MEKFDILRGVAAPLAVENVNTDAIMPTAWIIGVGSDWGRGLFGTWRRDREGRDLDGFVLNQARYRDARILVTGRNFGCGSSREEAVWGLVGYGIRCVVAPSFGDIFFDNAFKNGLLPVVLAAGQVEALQAMLAAAADPRITVDLLARVVVAPDGMQLAFAIDDGRRAALLEGMDEIGRTLGRVALIDAFQAADRLRRPWIHHSH